MRDRNNYFWGTKVQVSEAAHCRRIHTAYLTNSVMIALIPFSQSLFHLTSYKVHVLVHCWRVH